MKIAEIFEGILPPFNPNDFSKLGKSYTKKAYLELLQPQNMETNNLLELFDNFYHQVLIRECGNFIKQLPHGKPLLRGMPIYTFAEKLATQEKRRPVDTQGVISNIIDKHFEKQTGIRFRTNKIMFGTFNEQLASSYGNIYAAFPVGKFSYAFMPKVKDITTLFYKYLLPDIVADINDPTLSEIGMHNELGEGLVQGQYTFQYAMEHCSPKVKRQLTKEIKNAIAKIPITHDTNLIDADEHNAEVMVQCDSYYIVNNQLYEMWKRK